MKEVEACMHLKLARHLSLLSRLKIKKATFYDILRRYMDEYLIDE